MFSHTHTKLSTWAEGCANREWNTLNNAYVFIYQVITLYISNTLQYVSYTSIRWEKRKLWINNLLNIGKAAQHRPNLSNGSHWKLHDFYMPNNPQKFVFIYSKRSFKVILSTSKVKKRFQTISWNFSTWII